MKIGILGTGMVGQQLAAGLIGKNHEVMVGTREVDKTLARTEPDGYGNPPFSVWQKEHPRVRLGTFAEAAAHGEVVINATAGSFSLEALRLAGKANLDGKILMDIANPLDFSGGDPPSLFICNTDSLAERIQSTFPEARVVKTLNTVNATVMTNPKELASGDHTVFVSGNDAEAKAKVVEYLRSWFGWSDVVDLGDITTSRGTEMLLPAWLRLYGALQTPRFNFKIAR